jgi:hypothetical protein
MPAKSATVGIKIEADASDALRDVHKAEDALQDLEQAAKQVGSGADGIDQLTEAVKGLQEATEAAAEGGSGLSDAFAGGVTGSAVGSAISKLGGIVGEGFSKLAEIGQEAFSQAMTFDVGRDKLQAQLGLTAEQAKKMGGIAGDLYSDAYGESISQVNDALRLVTLNVGLSADTQAADLQAVTASVLDLASAFDQDLGGVTRAVGQLMKTGLAKNAKEAMDVLTRGFQIGNDKAEDLLDTVNEYSTSFRDVGLDAKQFMGILKQGLQGGARDADKVADAIKEFGIRSKDASQTSADAFKILGLNAKEMTDIFARGGKGAADGLDLVLDKLRGIEDPVARNAAAVGLFGTQAEDLGQALNSIDPSEAVAALGEVGGAADKMGKDLADNANTRFESWKRTVETKVITFIADNLLPALDSVGAEAEVQFARMGRAWDAFVQGFRGRTTLEVDNGQLTSSITAVEQMNLQSPFAQGSVQRDIEDLGKTVRQLTDEWLPKLKGALKEVGDQLDELKKRLDDNRQAMEILKALGIGALIVALLVLAGIIISVTGTVLLFGLIILGLLTPFALVKLAMDKLGITWGDVWNGMVAAVFTAKFLISVWISELMFILRRLVDRVWPDDWASLWDNITGIVRRAKDAVLGFIGDIKREIDNFLGLIKKISNPFSNPFGNPFASGNMAPVMMAGPTASAMVAPASAGAGSTVINVSVSHSGLGVDSPRLQRDIVEALRRYDRRNGRGSA